MERRPDDIFRVHDLSVLKSPMPTHLLNTSNSSSGTPKFPLPMGPVRPTPKSSFSPVGLSSLALSSTTPTATKVKLPNVPLSLGLTGLKATPNFRETPRWSPLGDATTLRPTPSGPDGTAKDSLVLKNARDEGQVLEEELVQEDRKQKRTETEREKRTEEETPVKCDTDADNERAIPSTIYPSTITSAGEEAVLEAGVKAQVLKLEQSQGANKTKRFVELENCTAILVGDPTAAALAKKNSIAKISLSGWSLVVVPNNPTITKLDKSVTEDWIVLVGRRPDMVEMWHSSLITGRVSDREIITGSGRIYSLEGPADELAFIEAGFSFETVEAFKLGFPENWQMVLIQEFGDSKSRGSERPEKSRKPSTTLTPTPMIKKKSKPTDVQLNNTTLAIETRVLGPVPEQVATKTASAKVESPTDAVVTEPVKRGRGRPPKNKNPPEPLRSPLATQKEAPAKENDQNQHCNNSLKSKQGSTGIVASPKFQSYPNKVVVTPSTPSEYSAQVKSGLKIERGNESDEIGSSKRRRKSEVASRWCDALDSPLSTTSSTDIAILGRTRSGRRVVAPLPYWENKYLRNISSVSQSPILRLRLPKDI